MRRRLASLAVAAVSLAAAGCTPWMDAPGVMSARRVVNAPGSQRAIDAGNVVNWNGCQPGECTVHLAGHRSTHGSVFANVTSLRPGHTVRYGYGGQIYLYRVDWIEDRCCSGDRVGYVDDLLVQTSLGGGLVRLVHCSLIGVR